MAVNRPPGSAAARFRASAHSPSRRRATVRTMHFDQDQRERICAEAKGKTVQSLEWSENANDTDGFGGYWVMAFTDGSKISFRLMVEMVPPES
jgi:hypothetical protein